MYQVMYQVMYQMHTLNIQVCLPSEPRRVLGQYWGYTTRIANGLSAALQGCPFVQEDNQQHENGNAGVYMCVCLLKLAVLVTLYQWYHWYHSIVSVSSVLSHSLYTLWYNMYCNVLQYCSLHSKTNIHTIHTPQVTHMT